MKSFLQRKIDQLRVRCECGANDMSYAAHFQMSSNEREAFRRRVENCQTCKMDAKAFASVEVKEAAR